MPAGRQNPPFPPDRPERLERLERLERSERLERLERLERRERSAPKRSWQKETFQTFLSFLSFLDAAKKPPPAKTGEGCLASSGRFELPAPRLGEAPIRHQEMLCSAKKSRNFKAFSLFHIS